jgi:hypothetical protein
MEDSGYKVNNWRINGDSKGSTNSINLIMDEDKVVELSFISQSVSSPDGSTPGHPTVVPTRINNSSSSAIQWKQPYLGGYGASDNLFHAIATTDYSITNRPKTWIWQDVSFQVLGGPTFQQPATNAIIRIVSTPQQDFLGGEIYFSSKTNSIDVVVGADGIATTRIWYVANDVSMFSRRAYITYISVIMGQLRTIDEWAQSPETYGAWGYKLHTSDTELPYPHWEMTSPTDPRNQRGDVEVSFQPQVHFITASYPANPQVQSAVIQTVTAFGWNVLHEPKIHFDQPLLNPPPGTGR